MTKRILVPLAEGFEEIEAVTVIDVLRRAGAEVVVAGLVEGPTRGSRGVVLIADVSIETVAAEEFDAVVLPGGGEGAKRLASDARVTAALERARSAGQWIAAICASPAVVLSPHGFLDGKRATCYPSFAERLSGYQDRPVVTDGRVVTSQGPGTAMEFALELVAKLFGDAHADAVRKPLLAGKAEARLEA